MVKGGMDYIRKTYRVPAKRGSKVFFEHIGKVCTIASAASGGRLIIKDDDGKRYLVHPTWQMDYLPTNNYDK